MFEKARVLLYWARFGGRRQLTLRWQPHKRRLQGKYLLMPDSVCFGNNLSPTNLLTLCKNNFVYSLMNNALLLITQQRQRTINSKQPQCMRACVIRRHVQQYVCVHIAEDAGSSAGK